MTFRPHKHHWTSLALFAGLGCSSISPAHADGAPHLLGDWNGQRSHLADTGITFDLGYGSEAAHNFSGGTKHLTRYTDQWKFGALFDLEKLWDWKGGTVQIVVTDRNGRNLGADANIGNNQLIQEVYGRSQTWHLTILALDQAFLDGKVDWRIGRLPVGEDFASFSCDFQNLTFCGAAPGNIVGDYWVNWPTSQWATRLKLITSKQSYLQIGAYQVNPTYLKDDYARSNGWKPDFPGGTTGVLIPLEFGWKPAFEGLPGSYKFGLWYNTSPGADLFLDATHQPIALTGNPALQRDSRRGAYINLQQQISGDAGATHANARVAADQRLYNSLHPHRQGPVKDGNEYVTELFYGWSLIPAITLRPNLQYILHPGGSGQASNALVIGLKTSLTF